MLEWGLKKLEGQRIVLPKHIEDHPDKDRLAKIRLSIVLNYPQSPAAFVFPYLKEHTGLFFAFAIAFQFENRLKYISYI